MRILFVAPWLPIANADHAGGRLGGFLLDRLSARHDVSLVARVTARERELAVGLPERIRDARFLGSPGNLVEGSLLSLGRSLRSLAALASEARRTALQGDFDVIQIEGSEVAAFWRRWHRCPVFVTCTDVLVKPAVRRIGLSAGLPRALARIRAAAVRGLEGRGLHRVDGVFTLSESDKEWAEREYPGIRPMVVRYPGGLGFSRAEARRVKGRVLFVGTLNRSANRLGLERFVEEAWPRIRESVPGAEFRVVGTGGDAGLAMRIEKEAGAHFVGRVGDLESEYLAAMVLVAPIDVGGGVIVKVLDALAAGTAVVTTEFGNEGIGGVPGRDLLVARTSQELAECVVRLLTDPAQWKAIVESGRSFVERHHPEAGVEAAVLGAYGRALGGQSVS